MSTPAQPQPQPSPSSGPIQLADVLRQLSDTAFQAHREILIQKHGALLGQKLATTLAGVNQQAVLQQAQGRWKVVVWDGTMPVNGVAPDAVRVAHRMDPTDGAYQLVDAATGQVIVFQVVKGVTDAATLAAKAQAHVQAIALDEARRVITEQVVLTLIMG